MLNRHPQPARYFARVKRYILSSGERFATVVDQTGVLAHYPTALALSRRTRGLSVETKRAEASDLVHIGLWAQRERIDLNARLEAGAYLDPVEVETLAEACGVKTASLRRVTGATVKEVWRGANFKPGDRVLNQQKSRQLSTAMRYCEYVGRMSESWLPKRSEDLVVRVAAREEMTGLIKTYMPKEQSSRIRGVIKAEQLSRVAAFVATGDPFKIWPNEALARRNWALIILLVTCGLRQGELRQLKPGDIDLAACELRVERRHDDPEEPRVDEPNAKTYDCIIPLGPAIAESLEEYMLGPGSDAAEIQGSAFVFLSHDNRTHGNPISTKTVLRAVCDLGKYLKIEGLTPHHLRHGWIQSLTDWGLSAGVAAAEFERIANNLGGWSYVSRMGSEYRGDHLADAANKSGVKVQGIRS